MFIMDSDGIWSKDLRDGEREGTDGKSAKKIFEMINGNELEDTRVFVKGKVTKG